MKADGTDRRKIVSQPILDLMGVSPDGRWVVAQLPNSNEEQMNWTKAVRIDGSTSIPLCFGYCWVNWDSTGKFVDLSLPEVHQATYVLPVTHDSELPKAPPAGFARTEDFGNAKMIPQFVGSVLRPSVYAYSRETTRRNLYRIQLP
jgi:hypothetical protein